ncbi:MAG: DUF1015 family protein, partial [Chloroflexota bacterium]
MAIQDPTRAWPWRRTRASILTDEAAWVVAAIGPRSTAATMRSVPSERIQRAAGRGRAMASGTSSPGGGWVGSIDAESPRKVARPVRMGTGRGSAVPIVRSGYQIAIDSQDDRPSPRPRLRIQVEHRGRMPVVRPFRALRYDPDVVGDLGRVVAPPYDVIDGAERERLMARSPYNVVRLDYPGAEDRDSDPNDR